MSWQSQEHGWLGAFFASSRRISKEFTKRCRSMLPPWQTGCTDRLSHAKVSTQSTQHRTPLTLDQWPRRCVVFRPLQWPALKLFWLETLCNHSPYSHLCWAVNCGGHTYSTHIHTPYLHCCQPIPAELVFTARTMLSVLTETHREPHCFPAMRLSLHWVDNKL